MDLLEVNALAEQYALRFNPDRVAPFPYENITQVNSDLEVFFIDLDDSNVSGATLYKSKNFSILVNTTKHENRQHFTLAHELGHYFLHKDILHAEHGLIDEDKELDGNKILYRLDDSLYSRIETEANHFAASLIMPAELVRKAWEATGGIEECAKIFRVSTIAMNIRLTELGMVQ